MGTDSREEEESSVRLSPTEPITSPCHGARPDSSAGGDPQSRIKIGDGVQRDVVYAMREGAAKRRRVRFVGRGGKPLAKRHGGVRVIDYPTTPPFQVADIAKEADRGHITPAEASFIFARRFDLTITPAAIRAARR